MKPGHREEIGGRTGRRAGPGVGRGCGGGVKLRLVVVVVICVCVGKALWANSRGRMIVKVNIY